MSEFWAEMAGPAPESVEVDGVELRRGSRVRLRPRTGGLLGLSVAGRVGIVEGIDQDDAGTFHLSVALEDDPGRDLGEGRFPGHRFFFAPEEVEPLTGADAPAMPRILVAGIGNVFFGDDGFGVEVAHRLAERPLAPGVDVVDFGIRGMDLVYALQRGYDAAILVDAVPSGQAPGTLSVLEPDLAGDDRVAAPEAHAMDPVRVLRLARAMGEIPPRTLVVGCEPAVLAAGNGEEVLVELSAPVRAAVDEAVRLVASLAGELGAPVGADGADDRADEDRGTEERR